MCETQGYFSKIFLNFVVGSENSIANEAKIRMMPSTMSYFKASFLRSACLYFAILACCGWQFSSAAEKTASLPDKVKKVLFLGDSITQAGTYCVMIQTYFATRHPERKIEWINCGLSSETVSGLSEKGHAGGSFPRPDLLERLARVLEQIKPDYVFACYGMNCAIYEPLDPQRFAAFQQGMKKLHDAVVSSGATIVHITPPIYDMKKRALPFDYNAVLGAYSDWMLEQKKSGWNVIDLHGPMTNYLTEQRKENPAFTISGDGIHPDENGHWFMAKTILLAAGADDLKNTTDFASSLANYPNGKEIHGLIKEKSSILQFAWLQKTGHKRPGVPKGLPIEEAQKKADELSDKIHQFSNR
jgi:lysophospholipase L1-like esterase